MIVGLVAEPVVEPLTLVTAKEHLRLQDDADDATVTALILAARQHVEKVTRRALLDQTWEVVLDGFPCGDTIELPKGNLQSVTAITYLDADNVLQTLSVDVYEVDTKSRLGRVILKDGQSWPTTRDRWNAVTITFECGYGPDADDVPQPVKQAMLLLVSQMYEHRVPEVTGTVIAKVGFAVEALLAPHKLRRVKRLP